MLLEDGVPRGFTIFENADAGKAMGARALVIFSTGAEGTSITPEDLADQAVAAGVPVYPVALPGFPWVLPYEDYTYRGPMNGGLENDVGGGNEPSMFGPGGARYCSKCAHCVASYINYPFELLGNLPGRRVKKHALARFSSNYTVGFVPSPSGAPREHKLEVKLAPKSSDKLTEGKRSAKY